MGQTFLQGTKIAVVGMVASFLVLTGVAYAAVPTLSLSGVSGNEVQVTVQGDANSNVMFYYNVGSSTGMQTATLGSTNATGYFSTTVSPSSYNINVGQSVYVVVDGQQSAMQTWPTPTGTPTLSEANISIGLGQSTTVYSEGSSAAVYMAANSNPSVASITASGTQLTVTGVQTGSTSASICYAGTASNCSNLYITVGASSVLSFSQNNLTLAVGQSSGISVSGGSGSYSITSNSNPGSISAVLSGNTITLTPSSIGSSNVAVCDTSGNCGTLYVTAGTTASNGSLYFSTSNPSIAIGQILTVTISGGSGYYITGNSNPSVASQSINGNTLTISGLEGGAATITVCSTSNGCSPISVTVGGTTSNGTVSFGMTNPTLTIGENTTIGLSGSGSYYISSNPNASVVQATVSGASLTLYAENAGSDSIVVCASGGGCNTLSVNVTAPASTSVSTATTSASALLAAIQSTQSELAQIVTQIQSMATTLTQAAAALTNGTTVSSGVGGVAATSANTGTTSNLYNFTQFLSVGSQGDDVTALQNYLSQKGFYSGPITGYYGSLTQAAVEKYQTAHGIDPAGYVGSGTRAALNAGE